MKFIQNQRSLSPSPTLREKAKVVPRQAIRYPDLFWLFLFGSLLGFLLEGLWNIAMRGSWANHAATVWGPFCIIYGLGAVAMYTLSFPLRERSVVVQFVIYATAGSLLEFSASLFQELCFGSTSWDYSDQFLNVGGRISLRMTLLWGILGLIFSLCIFPLATALLAYTHSKGWNVACGLLSVMMAANLLLTAAAVRRWHDRLEAIPAANNWEAYLDQTYDDRTMEEIFSNMVFE